MRNFLETFVNPWVIIGSLLIAGILSLLGLYWLSLSQAKPRSLPPSTAAVTVIPAATATSSIVVPPTNTPSPTLPAPPSPVPGTIVIGGFVQITGTGSEGLNMREEPSLDANIRYLGFEAEVFEVREGPVEAAGFVWWYLVGFSDESRNGWAVANYLDVIQNP